MDCPRHIDMSGDRKPDPVEHFNRDLSIYCVQPHINQCGDPEVANALKCGGQNAEGDRCTGVLKYHQCSLTQVIRLSSCVLQYTTFVTFATSFLTLYFQCAAGISHLFMLPLRNLQASSGFKVIFRAARRPAVMAQAMYKCESCRKVYGATDPHILALLPSRYHNMCVWQWVWQWVWQCVWQCVAICMRQCAQVWQCVTMCAPMCGNTAVLNMV